MVAGLIIDAAADEALAALIEAELIAETASCPIAGMAHRVKNILMGLEGGIFVVNEGLESGDQDGISEGWETLCGGDAVCSGVTPGAPPRSREL